jgi:glycosyltransferase involved in cell wall biosynthesis
MRVLHLVKTGRGAKWALLQMRELVRMGVEVHVAVPSGGIREPEYHAAGVKVHHFQSDISLREWTKIPTRFRSFRRLIGGIQPDLIHSHFVGTTLTMRMALGRNHPIPRVFQVPGPLHLEHPFFRHAEVASAGANDYWFGTCQWTCDQYLSMERIQDHHVFLRYYGKDLDTFQLDRPREYLRGALPAVDKATIVGMVAYMYPPKRYLGQRRGVKGHEDLIDALSICVARGHNVVGVFVGGASVPGHPYEQQVMSYAEEKLGDRAIFLGNRKDVPDLYPGFDIAVHPSHSENQGGAAESLLLSVPTIATDVGGFPDIVRPGVSGTLVPAKDPESMANAITDYLRNMDAARSMALAGREIMQQVGDARRNAELVHQTYQQILAKQGADNGKY